MIDYNKLEALIYKVGGQYGFSKAQLQGEAIQIYAKTLRGIRERKRLQLQGGVSNKFIALGFLLLMCIIGKSNAGAWHTQSAIKYFAEERFSPLKNESCTDLVRFIRMEYPNIASVHGSDLSYIASAKSKCEVGKQLSKNSAAQTNLQACYMNLKNIELNVAQQAAKNSVGISQQGITNFAAQAQKTAASLQLGTEVLAEAAARVSNSTLKAAETINNVNWDRLYELIKKLYDNYVAILAAAGTVTGTAGAVMAAASKSTPKEQEVVPIHVPKKEQESVLLLTDRVASPDHMNVPAAKSQSPASSTTKAPARGRSGSRARPTKAPRASSVRKTKPLLNGGGLYDISGPIMELEGGAFWMTAGCYVWAVSLRACIIAIVLYGLRRYINDPELQIEVSNVYTFLEELVNGFLNYFIPKSWMGSQSVIYEFTDMVGKQIMSQFTAYKAYEFAKETTKSAKNVVNAYISDLGTPSKTLTALVFLRYAGPSFLEDIKWLALKVIKIMLYPTTFFDPNAYHEYFMKLCSEKKQSPDHATEKKIITSVLKIVKQKEPSIIKVVTSQAKPAKRKQKKPILLEPESEPESESETESESDEDPMHEESSSESEKDEEVLIQKSKKAVQKSKKECMCKTSLGKRCHRNAMAHSKYCAWHQGCKNDAI